MTEVEKADTDRDKEDWVASEIIKVYVGPEKKRFNVHKDLICKHFPFFEKCSNNSNFLEGQTGEVQLVDDDSDSFALMLKWLYGRKLKLTKQAHHEITYIKSWILAEKLMMDRLQDEIMDAMRNYYRHNLFCAELLNCVPQDDLNSGSTLYRFVVDQAAWELTHLNKAFYHQSNKNLVSEARNFFFAGGLLSVDIIERTLKYSAQTPPCVQPSETDNCLYHSHTKDKGCYIKIDETV